MKKLLLQNCDYLVTMDQKRQEFRGYDVLINGPKIEEIASEISVEDYEVFDASKYWVFPGLINTHHHFFQTLTRVIPDLQGVELFQWLKGLYPKWAQLDQQDVYNSTLLALAELLKSGCTTSTDHHYVFPQKAAPNLIDYQIEASQDLGIRFHPCRGSMSRGTDQGGLPPQTVVQSEEEILKDSLRLIKQFHNREQFSMCQIVLAPCSPFSVSKALMEDTASLAREYSVQLHTHLAETKDEDDYCLKYLKMRPLEFMEQCGWLGEDVWFAHGIFFTDEELLKLQKTQSGVAHCPSSNQKLASGVAKIPQMLKMNIPVGLAVDGSASNDSSNLWLEMRTALLLHKLYHGVSSITAHDILMMATRGGSQLLGRRDIGSLAVNKGADLFMVKKDRLGFIGGQHSPVEALIACGDNFNCDYVMVNGKFVVKEGQLVKMDQEKIAALAATSAQKLVSP